MKSYRLIFHLSDGSRKYCTHRGKIVEWEIGEIKALRLNHQRYGGGAYLDDFSVYDPVALHLAYRYPKRKLLRVLRITKEDSSLPLNPEILLSPCQY